MITTMTAATIPAPACGPATDIAAAENASPAVAVQAAPSATHPNTTKKETIPMTDQTIPADEVRKIIAFYRDGASDRGGMILDALRNLLPPTLADMTPEEWKACQWMQADIIGGDEPLVITRIDWTDGTALILDRNGRLDGVPAGHVTPRPDLPRMTWPGDTPAPAPALPEGWRLADHPRYGRVFVTTPEPDCDGDLWFIDPSAAPGVMEDWCNPDVLTFLYEQGADQ